jgi:hypothetical protein
MKVAIPRTVRPVELFALGATRRYRTFVPTHPRTWVATEAIKAKKVLKPIRLE